jgi:hypothetical protein
VFSPLSLCVGALNFIKHVLLNLKTQIDPNTVVVRNFNTPLSPINRSSRQKINKEIIELNDTKDQMDLTEFYRVFDPVTSQYIFFSKTRGTFSKIDHILGHKASLNRKKI